MTLYEVTVKTESGTYYHCGLGMHKAYELVIEYKNLGYDAKITHYEVKDKITDEGSEQNDIHC